MTSNNYIALVFGGVVVIAGLILISRRNNRGLQRSVSFLLSRGSSQGPDLHSVGLVAAGVILEVFGVFMLLVGVFAR
jgi:hypothetical protein